LVLRGFELSDIDYFHRTMSDAEVTLHVGGPNSREDAYRKMMTGVAFWALSGVGMWAVDRKSDRQTIGHLGFFDFQRDMEPSIAGEPEMGWIFAREGQGQGFASEAGEAALAWFEINFGRREIPAIIALENGASMRLAERLGFVRQADATYKGEPTSYWRRPA
jgi:RimJ/RimL family protein N-acetyltransferase